MMTESRFSESDGGGRILLPFHIEPNQEDTIASHLTTGVTFLTKGQGNAPWTGYYVPWRGASGVWFEIRYDSLAKLWLAYRVARPAFNLLHEPSDRMNLDELRAQTIVVDTTEQQKKTVPMPSMIRFVPTPQSTAQPQNPTDSRPPSRTDDPVPGLGQDFGEGSKNVDKGKRKDNEDDDKKKPYKSLFDARGGGEDPSAYTHKSEEDRKMRDMLKAMRGDRLEGVLPEAFKGDRADTKRFLLAFDRCCFMNHDAGMIKDPMKRVALFLGLLKGRTETWSNRASECVRDGDELPPFGFDIWQVIEREFRDAFTNFADADKAHQDLLKLRMKEGRLDEYVGEFQDLVTRAGMDINEPSALRLFAQGLQGTLAHTCIYQNNPENFRQWVMSAQTNHRNWLKVQALKEHNPFQQTRRPGQNPFARRWNSGGQRPAQRESNAMDVDTIRKATTEDEKQKYRSEGRCFNCGKQGHLSRNCPDRKPCIAASQLRPPLPKATETVDDDFIRRMAEISMRMTPEQQDLLAKELVSRGADFQ
ncbi:hypothetical protein EDB89DRAFT_2029722 [Lactarius sanguifluus]|nr:hypothetical protein EDB89DRAFT_2029722 [Lactarius sanguifluus]